VCGQSSGHRQHSIPTHWGPPVAKQTASSERSVANARASTAAPSSPIAASNKAGKLLLRTPRPAMSHSAPGAFASGGGSPSAHSPSLQSSPSQAAPTPRRLFPRDLVPAVSPGSTCANLTPPAPQPNPRPRAVGWRDGDEGGGAASGLVRAAARAVLSPLPPPAAIGAYVVVPTPAPSPSGGTRQPAEGGSPTPNRGGVGAAGPGTTTATAATCLAHLPAGFREGAIWGLRWKCLCESIVRAVARVSADGV